MKRDPENADAQEYGIHTGQEEEEEELELELEERLREQIQIQNLRCYTSLWPETVLSDFLCTSIGRRNLLDSCPITGELVVNNGWKTPHYQPCRRHYDFNDLVYYLC